ncbi:MAG: response regulator [Verrucomicrobia bacterium]|nr:response regulator [Verrucomicrobiota bacterium]MDA1067724.1 response regulator [Verrucomicrobiota bacterium]
MFSKSSRLSANNDIDRTKEELVRLHRRSHLLEQRLRNNQQVFVDFESIAKAVSHLIKAHKSDQAVLESLALVGEGSGLDRIYLLKNETGDEQGGVIDQVYTWVSESDDIQVPEFHSLPFEAFFPSWLNKWKAGEPLWGNLEDVPDIEHLTLAKQGVVSFLWIPVFYENVWWGVLGFDQISTTRVWHPKEISGYELLATSIVEFMRRQKLESDLLLFQERHEKASHAEQFGVWDWNIEKNELFLDSSIKRMAGRKANEIIEDLNSWEALFILRDHGNWVEALNLRIAAQEKDFELEHHLRHADGRLIEVYSRGMIVYSDSGKPVRVLGTTTDITHRKSIQNDLTKARDLAEEGSRSKSEFMAKMSHEIRTPLNGVIGFATLLKHTELSSEQLDYLTNLETSGRLLLSMVNNILDFSKIEAGKLDLEQKPFDIRESVKSILGVFGDAVIKKGIKIEFVAEDEVPESVITDPLRIQQVILNLVGNAVKFTEEGSILVHASWVDAEDGKGRLHFSVKDSGIGIESDRLAAIFEPFTQADSSMTRRFGGSGLGLSICQNILQIMGSKLVVTSDFGSGSEFSFEILVKESPVEVVEELKKVRESVLESTSKTISRSKMDLRAKAKILLAEDNALNQQVISKLLSRLGYNAVLVENGQEAIDALKRWKFDLVFMDLMMPVLDGISATKEIRETIPPAKQPIIVALTANSSEDDINNCLAIGMNDFITKPVELDVLEKTLNEHLDLRRYEVESAVVESEINTIEFSEIELEESFDEDADELVFEHFDPAYMRKLMGSNSEPEVQDEFSIDAIDIFLETMPELVLSLSTFAREEKWKEFEREAHNLKGTAKMVGALILGNFALQLELWVQEGHVGSRKDEIEQIADEFAALSKELDLYRESLKKKQRQIS